MKVHLYSGITYLCAQIMLVFTIIYLKTALNYAVRLANCDNYL